jgi:hypothetical protein
MVDNVEKADKVWDEATRFRNDKYNWKMGTDFKACNEKEFIDEMENKYKYLKTSSSSIFKQILEQEKFDMEKLKYMLDMLRSIGKKQISFENASKEVGQKFANEYVKPLVDKLDKNKDKDKDREEPKIVEEN